MNPERTSMKTATALAGADDTRSHPKSASRSESSLSAKCLICEGLSESRLLFYTSRPIFQCPNCNLVFADQRGAPAVDYSEDYYRDGVYADYLADREAIQRNAPRVLKELERMVEGRKMLDVGCATGFFSMLPEPAAGTCADSSSQVTPQTTHDESWACESSRVP